MPAFDPANRLPALRAAVNRLAPVSAKPNPAELGLQWERLWLPPSEEGRSGWGADGGPTTPVCFLTHLFRRGGKTV